MQYVGKNKRTFKNPIYQNYGHIKALANLLNIDENKFFSIICFSNQAKLKEGTSGIASMISKPYTQVK